MKRALLSQMTNEWKTNIWLVVELAIVALAIWAILSFLWMECKGIFYPRGFEPADVYSIEVKSISETSPYYLKEYKGKFREDRDALVRRLKENPNVEYVSVHSNFMPYFMDYIGNLITFESLPDSITYYGNVRIGQPDMIRILNVESATGKTSDELVAMLERGEMLLSGDEEFEKRVEPVNNFIGKIAYLYGDTLRPKKIGDIVKIVRRSDYEVREGGMIILNYEPNEGVWGDIALKVKPGKGKEFENDFNSDASLSRLRNVYLTNLKSLVSAGESVHRKIETNMRLLIAISFFLLVTIFLGLLGSFWFRVQQRISEIAIRKTFGATDSMLFRRIFGEALILLFMGLVIISACVWPFFNRIADFTGERWWTLLAIEALTAGVMALGIVASVWYPAYRAMKIQPAIAVKEE